MIRHNQLGTTAEERSKKISSMIRSGEIVLGGYLKGKIYGLLNCPAGKRMNMENRVFFKNEAEALANDYRPCGRCLPEAYKIWKKAGNSKLTPQEPGFTGA